MYRCVWRGEGGDLLCTRRAPDSTHVPMCSGNEAPTECGRRVREAYLNRILCQSHGPNAYLRRRNLPNEGQHVRCVKSATTRFGKFFVTPDITYVTLQMLNIRIQLIDLETVYKTPCTVQSCFCKIHTHLHALKTSGRLYPQMLSGKISGYFYF